MRSFFFSAAVLIFSFNFLQAQNCPCKYIVPGNEHEVNGNQLNIQPGDTVCLDASIPYRNLKFTAINGTKEKPVVITNCGGIAKINSEAAFGVKFMRSKHFKLTGTGDSTSTYGIRITTRRGFFLTMESFSTNFEIDHIEIAGVEVADTSDSEGFAGIGVKTKPFCDGSANRGVWDMYDVSIHHNYIHDTGGEGLYIGHGFYNGRKEKGCPDTTYSHSIIGLRVYNNLIENTGYDGIQVKNADKDCEIHHNIIRNYGTSNHGAHNEGIFIGEGTTGKVYNNWIEKGSGNGIQFQGLGNNDFYNNVIINPGGNGFYGAGGKHARRLPDGYVRIYNNTFIIPGEYGFLFYNNDGGPKALVNNIFVIGTPGFTKKGAKVELANNIVTANMNDLHFKGSNNLNFELNHTSPAVNSGKDLSRWGIQSDYNNSKRPAGAGFDIGAFEFFTNR